MSLRIWSGLAQNELSGGTMIVKAALHISQKNYRFRFLIKDFIFEKNLKKSQSCPFSGVNLWKMKISTFSEIFTWFSSMFYVICVQLFSVICSLRFKISMRVPLQPKLSVLDVIFGALVRRRYRCYEYETYRAQRPTQGPLRSERVWS